MPRQSMLLEINFLSTWHSGTGKGEGMHLDATTRKDELGLPMLPGRQIKGLIRHALTTGAHWNHWSHEVVDRLCGIGNIAGIETEKTLSRFDTQAGHLKISSARLKQQWIDYMSQKDVLERKPVCQHFYRTQRQTKLDFNGIAEDKSLRTLEVCIPVTLYSRIEWHSPEINQDLAILKQAIALIRSAGAHTSRGLGRVSCTLLTTGDAV